VSARGELEHRIHGDGEPLLFLGNLAGPAWSMGDFAPVFANAGFGLVEVLHTGPGPDAILDSAGRVAELLDELDIEPWLWGISQGAFIAQEIALLRPDRVRGAVLTGTRGRPSGFFHTYLTAALAIEDGSVPDTVADAFLLLAFMPPDFLADDDQTRWAAKQVGSARHAADRERNRRSLAASAGYGDRLAALGGVRVPCRVIAFEHDAVCPPRAGREVAEAIPGCDYVEIEGAGHSGLTTHPVEVLTAVTEFLTAARPGKETPWRTVT
jgi:pimeloyl-ACP methyl ester carboxylesterase